MAHFDVLRGRGHGLWRDVGVLDLPRIMRYHHIAYEVLTEACKRLAYDRWLVEVRTFVAFPCERLLVWLETPGVSPLRRRQFILATS